MLTSTSQHSTRARRAMTLSLILTALGAACSTDSAPTSPVVAAPVAASLGKSICGPRCANPILFDGS